MHEEIDLNKQLVELAVTAGRSHQSSQTRFVHYCHHQKDEGVNHTIPLYENALFALALMKMHTAQNINEGKALLLKLLPFQAPDGNFPAYLHDFPTPLDRYAGIHLLPVFQAVLKEFSKVIGSDLKAPLEESAVKLLEYSLKNSESAPFHIAVKIAASAKAFGKMLERKEWEKEGEARMEALRKDSEAMNFGSWYCPDYIAETLIALQMLYPKISESPWKSFWEYLSKTWFPPARCYSGPAIKQLQWKRESQPTLYDLFLGDFTGGYPYHSLIDHPFQLQGALVSPVQEELKTVEAPKTFTGEVSDQKWIVRHEPGYAYSAIETPYPIPPEMKKGYHPFKMVWGDRNIIHSLVVQGGKFTNFDFEEKEGGCDLIYILDEEIDTGKRDPVYEVQLFCDKQEGVEFFVHDRKATTFAFDQPIKVATPDKTFSIEFKQEGGEGRFFGHIMPGNRPSQVNLKGKHRFDAYDWQILLRTVKRETACQIRVVIRVLD